MREVQITVWCDRCAKNEHKTLATHPEVPLSVHKDPEVTLDLCDSCYDRLAEFHDLAHTHGNTPADKTPKRTRQRSKDAKGQTADLTGLVAYEGPRTYATPQAKDSAYAIPCPLCPLIIANRQVLSSHAREVHSTGLRELVAAGLLPTVDEAPYPPTPAERASTTALKALP
jgi:hypothetical protein